MILIDTTLVYATLILACLSMLMNMIALLPKSKEKSLIKRDPYKDYRDPVTGLLKAKRMNKQ